VESLKAYYHGGPNYAELEQLGISPDEVLDFSVSSNPFGPPPRVKEALATMDITRYPDSEATQLRRSLSLKLSISPQNILVGSGSTELVRIATLAYLEQEDAALIIEPTFGEYEAACRIARAQVLKQWLSQDEGFKLKLEESIGLIQRYEPKIIFICNPNNPTGQYLDKGEVKQVLASTSDSLVVLDEAYVSFVAGAWSSLDMIWGGNLLILRSMTKDYALAGLRLGYAIAHERITTTLRRVCPPWNVNAVAQQAGILALSEEGYLEQCRVKTQQAKEYLLTELTHLGLSPSPSQANFFLMKVGDARQFRQALLEQRILVRDCTSFGLPQYVRIAPRTMPECQRLIEAIEEIIKRGSLCLLKS
jgi:histidinol-phosphate aminotransferase